MVENFQINFVLTKVLRGTSLEDTLLTQVGLVCDVYKSRKLRLSVKSGRGLGYRNNEPIY